MKIIKLKERAAQTESTTGAALPIVEDGDGFKTATFILDVTALATQTADKLDVYVDFSWDASTWVNAVHFTQMDGDGSAAREIAKVTNGELNDPDAIAVVTADAAETVVRNTGIMPYVRYRSAITDASTDDASFTYSLIGVLN